MRFTLVVCAIVAMSCAGRRAPEVDPRVEAHAELRAGCYRCLEGAFALVNHRSDPASAGRAFELALLLALRAKELGLPFEPWRQRATDLAARLPAAWAAGDFLAIVDAMPLDAAGFDRERSFRSRRPAADALRQNVAAIQQTPAAPETKAYFELAVTCTAAFAERDAVFARLRPAADATPLLAYAFGLCGHDELRLFSRVMADEPRFADAAYPLGKYLFRPPRTSTPLPDAADLLAQARAAFPQSAAITYTQAALRRARRQWPEALAGFDATIALVPKHHDARLGRVMALSNLTRHDEAIAGATGLIDEGTWLVGDAYYWRAWNEFQLDRLDASEQDVERAKKYLASSSVYVLSGAVQWRKGRPTVAESEFLRAMTIDQSDCDASTYLGRVRAELRAWRTAEQAFAVAETCRDNEAAELKKTLDELVQANGPEAAVDAQRRSVAETEQQSAEMAFNRGVMLAQAGDIAAARAHLERASRHPMLQVKAAAALQQLRERH